MHTGNRPKPAPHVPRLPCRHLGPETRRQTCATCAGKVELKVFGCAVHGECTAAKRTDGVKGCCEGCGEYVPDTFKLVAPLGAGNVADKWQGSAAKRPWAYRVSVALPHLDTPDELEACVDLLRLQTERPYLIVVDTGSPPEVCERLERLRSEDLEVHFVRAHGYVHSSAPVTTAMDLAFALCRTPYLLATHTDVFARRRDWVAWMLAHCSEGRPVAGWEMSPRSASAKWKGTVSHTSTIFYMPTMRRIGATWSVERWYERNGVPAHATVGWPDTESTMRDCLDGAGIVPLLLGPEGNYRLDLGVASYIGDPTVWYEHARSIAGTKAYCQGTHLRENALVYGGKALADARRRAADWKEGRP
jgi:hypothetical protein